MGDLVVGMGSQVYSIWLISFGLHFRRAMIRDHMAAPDAFYGMYSALG